MTLDVESLILFMYQKKLLDRDAYGEPNAVFLETYKIDELLQRKGLTASTIEIEELVTEHVGHDYKEELALFFEAERNLRTLAVICKKLDTKSWYRLKNGLLIDFLTTLKIWFFDNALITASKETAQDVDKLRRTLQCAWS